MHSESRSGHSPLRGLGAGIVLTGVCAAYGNQAQATNWIMLQSTEPAGGEAKPILWGFVQADYSVDQSDANATGTYIPSKLLAPDYRTQEQFNVSRARIGLRGRVAAEQPDINYFLLTEFGNNAITAASDRSVALSDASVTFNQIPHARVRAGLFKTPGGEEGLMGVHAMDFIEFSWVTNFLLLERPPNSTFLYGPSGNIAPADPADTGTALNGFTEPVAAFRDVGVMVFDALDFAPEWELTYAAMLGNGNGLNFGDNDDNKDLYGYLALERVYGGKGLQRDGAKVFAWTQSGKRTFDGDNDGSNNEYDRDRSGVGVSFHRRPWRATAEYIQADGMIFLGPDKPSFDLNGVTAAGGSGLEGEADGWYVEGGWRIGQTPWELDARYEVLTQLDGDPLEMEFVTYTLGVQYFFSAKARIAVNWSDRTWEAVEDSGAADAVNANLEGVGSRYGVQVTVVF